MTQPTLIAPFKTGLDTDIADWLAPPDSFQELDNFHVHHGYIQKRSGYRVFGYMVHDPVATITGISQANPAVVTAANTFTNGQKVLITNVTGMTEVNNQIYTVANAAAGSFELSGVDSTGFTSYSAGGRAALVTEDRIMGIHRYLDLDGTKVGLIFDTTRAAVYDGTNNRYNPLDTADIMSGSDVDYIWAENWQATGGNNRLYFTNGKEYDGASLDGIRYYEQTTSALNTVTTSFVPALSSTRNLYGSKLIFAIKQRLVVLNTFENNGGGGGSTNYPQRARWCAAQNPGNWDDTVAGGGGFVDAPTGDQIVSARALQDQIIVFFTNSVWTLRPVPNPALPFRWDKINDFRACDGKMSTIQYDRYVVAFGVRGITATDGVETKRIDNRIQDFTVDEVNVDEFQKVYGARNYDNQRMWALFASGENDENNKALILDDDSLAFSEYEIGMNCLGYGNFSEDYALEDFIAANDLDITIAQGEENTLIDYFWQDNAEAFLGGDTSGAIYVLQTGGDDDGTAITCNLLTNAWNPYQAEGKEAQLNYVDILVDTAKNTELEVEFYKNSEFTPYVTRQSDILPPLGYIASISNITQANPAVVTAPENGLSTGDVIYIYNVNGMVEVDGEYTITVIDENSFSLDGIDSSAFTAYTTGGQVVQKEFYRDKCWKRILAGGIGYQHRMRISSTGTSTPLKIEAFKPSFRPRGRRTIN